MVDAIVEMKRSSEAREKFDTDGPPDSGALKVHKMAEKVIPAVIGFGWILSAVAKRSMKVYLSLRRELAVARHEHRWIEARMEYWDADVVAFEAVSVLDKGSYEKAERWLVEPQDVDAAKLKVDVLKVAERLAERDFANDVFRDPDFDVNCARVLATLDPPEDLRVSELAAFNRRAMEVRVYLDVMVLAQVQLDGATDEEKKRVRQRLREGGFDVTPTLAVIRAEEASAVAERQNTIIADEAVASAERKRVQKEGAEAARYRNVRGYEAAKTSAEAEATEVNE